MLPGGVIYRSICRNSYFFMNFKIEYNELFGLWNTERILISETPKIVSDKSKFLNVVNLENQRCWFGAQKVTLYPKKPATFLFL